MIIDRPTTPNKVLKMVQGKCLFTMVLLAALMGCDQETQQLSATNKALTAELQALKQELESLKQATPRADRELQTFEDMYVACQLAHPQWRYLGTEE